MEEFWKKIPTSKFLINLIVRISKVLPILKSIEIQKNEICYKTLLGFWPVGLRAGSALPDFSLQRRKAPLPQAAFAPLRA
jgi:hypothetical protein